MAQTTPPASAKIGVADAPDWAGPSVGLEQRKTLDLRTHTRTGLNNLSGIINEERLPELQGWRGQQTYRQMVDSDAVIGGMYYVFDKLLRQIRWSVERSSDHPGDRDAAIFLEQVINDMQMSWTDFISEVGTFYIYGFSAFEIIWKQRTGFSEFGWLNSKYADGRIGISNLSLIGQDSFLRWPCDALGNILGVEQQVPSTGFRGYVPFNKMLLFRMSIHKNNPMGQSGLRSAFRSWMLKRAAENIETMGLERDATGLPVLWAPDHVTAANTPETQQQMAQLRDIATNIRRNTQEGLVMPLAYDQNGNKMFQIELVQSGGARQFDSNAIIRRLNEDLVNTMQAGFMLLGQNGSGGSYAMHADKSELFTQGVSALADMVEDVLNTYLIPRLFRLNGFAVTEYPKLKHGPVGGVNLKDVGEFLRNIAGAGMAPPADDALMARLMEMVNLPVPTAKTRETPPEPQAAEHPDLEPLHDLISLQTPNPEMAAPAPSPQAQRPSL